MKMPTQLLRRTVQLSVLFLLFAIPAITYYRSQLKQQDFQLMLKDMDNTDLQARSLRFIDSVLRVETDDSGAQIGAATENEETQLHLKNFLGNHWSAKIGPIPITEPLAGVSSVFSFKSLWAPLLIGLILPVLFTVIFGRIFCSWICPAGFIFEMSDKVRTLLKKGGLQIRQVKLWGRQNILILCVGLIVSSLISLPVLTFIYPPAILARDIHHGVYLFLSNDAVVFSLSTTLIFFLIVILLEVFLSRRLWCTYLCPGGALYGLLGTFRLFRVQVNKNKCTDCGKCVQACPMNLNPMMGKMGNQCDNCQLCIKSCQDDALKVKFSFSEMIEKKVE